MRSALIVPDVVTGFVPPRVKVEFGEASVTDVTVPPPPTAGVEVAMTWPLGSTARKVPAAVPRNGIVSAFAALTSVSAPFEPNVDVALPPK